ncbi:MAG: leucine-rich repeat domain-containing protein, partial [Actinomycetota bacterium]
MVTHRVRALAATASVAMLVLCGIGPAFADGGQTLTDCINDTIASYPPETPESSITGLDCSAYSDVTSLDGIQALTGLTSVTIVGAPGADGNLAPLEGLDLHVLSIESFGITDITVLRSVGDLQTLNVSGNHITDLTGLRACELFSAADQTVSEPAAVAGVPAALPAVTDTAGTAVP